MNPILPWIAQEKLERDKFLLKSRAVFLLGCCWLGCVSLFLWIEIAFFSLNILSIFVLWGRVSREDGILAGKKLYFPPFVMVLIFGADCFMHVGHISCILYMIRMFLIALGWLDGNEEVGISLKGIEETGCILAKCDN